MKPTICCLAGIITLASLFSLKLSAEEKLPILKVNFPADHLVYDYYIDGEMVLEDSDGTLIELPAKFKTRGATALQYTMKPSFNMKLETPDGTELDTNLLGIRKSSSFILDAMAIDRICMRNRVCFDIWNSYSPLPYATDFDSRNGTAGKFVIVYMNDQYKGIYCLTDKINRKLLDLKKPKVEEDEVIIRGVLYKQGTTDIGNQETPGFYNNYMVYIPKWHDAWELKEPDDYPGIPAWQPLMNYCDNYGNIEYISDNFYEENLIDYSLLIMALCIKDNWGLKNKYYSIRNSQGNDDDRRFIVTPWDLDTSLGGHYNGDYYDGNYSEWTMKQIAQTSLSPFSICFTLPDVKERMKKRWQETRETAFSVENVASLMDSYCNLFLESGAWQQQVEFWDSQTGMKPKYVKDLRKEIDLIKDWYARRFVEMDEYFGIDKSTIDEATIDEINNEFYINGKIYNLQGIEVEPGKLFPGDIYISEGKKFIKR